MLEDHFHLPEDLVLQILLKLPIESVIRFKRVCKSWYNLITISSFFNMHLEYYYNETTRNGSCLLTWRHCSITDKKVMSLVYNFSTTGILIIDLGLPQDFLNYTQDFLNYTHGCFVPRIIGPINGIYCLCMLPNKIVLCNPATSEYKILPGSRIFHPNHHHIRNEEVGFGFDLNTKDYKVLRILWCFQSDPEIYQVEIYSLSTNSWRKFYGKLPDGGMQIYSNSMPLPYKNGSICCWLAWHKTNMDTIVSFDVNNEVLECTPLPFPLPLPEDIELTGQKCILPLYDSITLVVYPQEPVCFYMWLLNGLGSEGSWIRLPSIELTCKVIRPHGFCRRFGFVLVDKCGELVSYSPYTKEIKHLGLHGNFIWVMEWDLNTGKASVIEKKDRERIQAETYNHTRKRKNSLSNASELED